MQAISRITVPTSVQSAAVQHIITQEFIENSAATAHRMPESTRIELHDTLVMLDTAQAHLLAANINDAVHILKPLLNESKIDYLKKHGFIEQAGVLQCIQPAQETAQTCGTAQEPVVFVPESSLPQPKIAESSCGTTEQLKPEEQLPNCGNGDVIKQQPEPVDTCNWDQRASLPSFGDNKTATSVQAVDKDARYKIVADTGEKCRIPYPENEVKAILDWAPEKYDAIRQLSDDVKKIAENTQLNEDKVQIIKDHLFHSEHRFNDGRIEVFGADHDIAAAWDRLYHGDFIKNDLRLLEHELFEAVYEKLHQTTCEEAHNAAQGRIPPIQGSPWDAPKFK